MEFEDKEKTEEPTEEDAFQGENADAEVDADLAADEEPVGNVDAGEPFPDDIFATAAALSAAELAAALAGSQAVGMAAAGGARMTDAGGGEKGKYQTRRGREVQAVSYDFRRPIQLSKGFSRSLTIVTETFAKLLTLSLSNYLRIPVTVSARGVRQALFEEYTKSIKNPSCINILELSPIKIPGMLDLDIQLIFGMIEKLLGSGEIHGDVQREFTAIESRIARKIILRMLTDLREALLRILEVDVGLNAIEHNPDFTYIMNANDPCILLDFEIEMGEFTGKMSICISLAGIDAEVGTEGASPYRDVRTLQERRDDEKRMALVLDSTATVVVAEVGRIKLSYEDLQQLREGSILSLRKHRDEPMKVSVGDCPLFLAKMGRYQSKSAVRITEVLRPRDNPLGGSNNANP